MPSEGILLGRLLAIEFNAEITECLFILFFIFDAVASSFVIYCCNLLVRLVGEMMVIHDVLEIKAEFILGSSICIN
jgi:hypothetical protein